MVIIGQTPAPEAGQAAEEPNTPYPLPGTPWTPPLSLGLGQLSTSVSLYLCCLSFASPVQRVTRQKGKC